jgi:MurNAc alpha-1-phosphate uridylyltransferase
VITVGSAIILAAGYGKRMMPLSATTPKPLITVAGKPMIDYGYEKLAADGVSRIVVNAHYLAARIHAWAAAKSAPPVIVSDEPELLDTGGGVANAKAYLRDEPFFILNGDSFWLDGCARPALERLRAAFTPGDTDAVLLLSTPAQAVGYDGDGDFILGPDGRLTRGKGHAALAFAGCQIVAPALFDDVPQGAFSTNFLWDRAIAAGRLRGIVHDGIWLHVGTPQAIALAESRIRAAIE